MNFAIPISVAMQFLHELNITPEESSFTRKFKEAKAHFDEGEYRESLEILRNINETNPGYPVVADLLAQASSLEENQPQVKESPASSSPLVYLLAGLVALLLIALLVLQKKGRDKAQQPPPLVRDEKRDQVHQEEGGYCTSCGHHNPPGTKFCSNCGNKLL